MGKLIPIHSFRGGQLIPTGIIGRGDIVSIAENSPKLRVLAEREYKDLGMHYVCVHLDKRNKRAEYIPTGTMLFKHEGE